MRLACRSFAVIGLHYLLRSYHLIFKQSSFQRLLEISRHPVVSQRVESIFYETDMLHAYDNIKDWTNNINDCNPLIDMERLGMPGSSEQGQRLWHRRFTKIRQSPRWTYSKKQLHNAYDIYKSYMEDQTVMRQSGYNAHLLSEAMRRLPNLVSLRMSMGFGLAIRSDYMQRAFSHALQKPYRDEEQLDCQGIVQLQSLLLGAEENTLMIQQLHCGYVDWRLFKAEEETFVKLQKAVHNLKDLKLCISTSSSSDDPDDDMMYHSSILECAPFFRKGRLREFVFAAPGLTSLYIEFDTNDPQSPARLVDIVGSLVWPALRRVYFGSISFNSDELISFYSRHSTTLEDIGFDDITLLQGTWQALFPRIKNTLKQLKDVTVAGQLWESDHERYYFGLPPTCACEGDRDPLIRRLVERYLLSPREDLVLPDLEGIPTDGQAYDSSSSEDSEESDSGSSDTL